MGLGLAFFGNWSNVKLDGVRCRRRLLHACLSLLLPEAVKPPPWRERLSGRRLVLLARASHRLPLMRAERVQAAGRIRVCVSALIIRLAGDRALLHALRVHIVRRRLSVLPEHLASGRRGGAVRLERCATVWLRFREE